MNLHKRYLWHVLDVIFLVVKVNEADMQPLVPIYEYWVSNQLWWKFQYEICTNSLQGKLSMNHIDVNYIFNTTSIIVDCFQNNGGVNISAWVIVNIRMMIKIITAFFKIAYFHLHLSLNLSINIVWVCRLIMVVLYNFSNVCILSTKNTLINF